MEKAKRRATNNGYPSARMVAPKSAGEITKLVRMAAKSFNDALDTADGQSILRKEGIYTKTGQLTKRYR